MTVNRRFHGHDLLDHLLDESVVSLKYVVGSRELCSRIKLCVAIGKFIEIRRKVISTSFECLQSSPLAFHVMIYSSTLIYTYPSFIAILLLG